jgi:hypothetical protein
MCPSIMFVAALICGQNSKRSYVLVMDFSVGIPGFSVGYFECMIGGLTL